MRDESRRAADGYWSTRFGCTPEELRPPQALVFPERIAGYAGVYAMEFGAAPIISAAPELVPTVRARASELTRAGVSNPEQWVGALGDPPYAVVGPAWIGCLDVLPTVADASARLLGSEDAELVAELRAACATEEWEEAGVGQSPDRPVAGAFAGGALVAVADYESWGGRLAHIGVLTHPHHRRRGHATRVVRAVTQHALMAGLVPQYRALQSNTGSLGVARRLGFVRYATSLALRSPVTGRR